MVGDIAGTHCCLCFAVFFYAVVHLKYDWFWIKLRRNCNMWNGNMDDERRGRMLPTRVRYIQTPTCTDNLTCWLIRKIKQKPFGCIHVRSWSNRIPLRWIVWHYLTSHWAKSFSGVVRAGLAIKIRPLVSLLDAVKSRGLKTAMRYTALLTYSTFEERERTRKHRCFWTGCFCLSFCCLFVFHFFVCV